MAFPASELITTKAGAVYHLNLLPEQIAPTIFLVGDPDRVPQVSRYFEAVWYRVKHREFSTHTGMLHGMPVSVVSTGIGTDNIDIVINELDALFNIDLISRKIKTELTSLRLIRLGTSGALRADIELDSLVCSSMGLGLDGLMPFYQISPNEHEASLRSAFSTYLPEINQCAIPLFFECSSSLMALINNENSMKSGITVTCAGFYAPQGRELRYQAVIPNLPLSLGDFEHDGHAVTNFEMETAGLYGLARLLGHQALSVNAIIANRITGQFSQMPQKTINRLIRTVLEKLKQD